MYEIEGSTFDQFLITPDKHYVDQFQSSKWAELAMVVTHLTSVLREAL